VLLFTESDRRILDLYLEVILDRYKMNEIDLDDVREEIVQAFVFAAKDRESALRYMQSVMAQRTVD
jgi:hypothetical protein